MRLLPSSLFVLFGALATACGGSSGPKTTQEVADKVVAALVAKDWNQLKPLYWTVDAARATCTEVPEDKVARWSEDLAEELAKSERDFAKCLTQDWTGAKVVAVKGGEPDDAVKGCAGKVMEADAIKIEVEAGGKKTEVRINDAVKVGEEYFLIERIRCRAPELSCDEVFDKMSKLVAGASEARESEKQIFDGSDAKRAEFRTMCDRVKSMPEARGMFECLANASTYADSRECEKQMGGGERDEAPAVADTAVAEPPTPTPSEPAAPVAAEPVAAPVADGGDGCDKLMAKMSECVQGMPEGARSAMTNAIDQMKKALEGQSAEGKAFACKSALDTSKSTMAQLCPNVKWD